MNDNKISVLVKRFRYYIENAQNKHLFQNDIFNDFPYDCCGDTCCLLAEFLLRNGIETIIVSGENEKRETHAWLVVKDYRINKQVSRVSNDIVHLLNSYQGCDYNTSNDFTYYVEDNLIDGLIIDITADQFGMEPIYVDYTCDFYKDEFVFVQANDFFGLNDNRLIDLYNTIVE